MLTIKKIKIYNKFGGDIDGFSRGRKMSQQNLFNDNDWSLIDEFEQDIKLISDRVVSKEYREKALIKLNKNCDLQTKEYFKSKIPFYSDFKEVSIIVANIKLRINDETDTVWAGFENTEALIKELDYDKKQIEFIGVEAGGPKKSKRHAAPLTYGSKIGILHGAAQYVNQDAEGQIEETESISAGLDYPGVSPLHCFLKDTKRARYSAATDEEALKAYQLVTKYENLNPSLEPSHAFAEAIKIAPKLGKDTIIIVNSCGDAQKDRDILKKRLGK